MDGESHDGYFSFGPQFTDCSDSGITGSAWEDPLWLLLSMHLHPGQQRNKEWGRAARVCIVALTLTSCATLSQLCESSPRWLVRMPSQTPETEYDSHSKIPSHNIGHLIGWSTESAVLEDRQYGQGWWGTPQRRRTGGARAMEEKEGRFWHSVNFISLNPLDNLWGRFLCSETMNGGTAISKNKCSVLGLE